MLLLKKLRFHHVTPLLRELHWLPDVFQVQFKVLVITYKTLYNFLAQLIHTNLCMNIMLQREGLLGISP